jgi:hypothetical protein
MEMTEVQKNIKLMSDEELCERYGRDAFSDEAKVIALAEIKSRGLTEPSKVEEVKKDSFYKRHPLISLVIFGLIAKVVMEIVKRFTN